MKLSDITSDMLCYLAAPYSGTESQIEARMELMCKADARLTGLGIDTVTPLAKHFILPHNRKIGSDWAFWKRYSEKLMDQCDVLLVLCMEGWEKSTGVQGEIEMAFTKGIPIIYLNADATERK